MYANESTRVILRQPIPVIVFYLTASVMSGGDGIHFVDDIYGHDARLDRYLTSRRES